MSLDMKGDITKDEREEGIGKSFQCSKAQGMKELQ